MAEIQVMKNILGENDRVAAENQALFAEKNVYVINLMGSPGAGKTSVLEKTMEKLKDRLKMAVIEGDLFTSKDADRIEKHGVPVIQINTAGGCHLDAPMVQKVAQKLDLDGLDLLVDLGIGRAFGGQLDLDGLVAGDLDLGLHRDGEREGVGLAGLDEVRLVEFRLGDGVQVAIVDGERIGAVDHVVGDRRAHGFGAQGVVDDRARGLALAETSHVEMVLVLFIYFVDRIVKDIGRDLHFKGRHITAVMQTKPHTTTASRITTALTTEIITSITSGVNQVIGLPPANRQR